jgi:transaldolase/glucose-6-phosphate isomerase
LAEAGGWRLANIEIDPPGDAARRLWARDSSLWGPGEDDPAERLGWLDVAAEMAVQRARLERFAAGEVARGIETVVLLGMGGSSLAPEVFARSFGPVPGYPQLVVLDSTHPAHVAAVTQGLDLDTCLWLVSSKSGGTVETLSLYRHFRSLVDDGSKFVAITDPGSSLEKLAEAEDFRACWLSRPDVGGRYSALTHFGLVPAALVGAPLDLLLAGASEMAEQCSASVPGERNPGVVIGAALGQQAAAGRDKLTWLISDELAAFGDWVEQLIAESTGKNGKGIAPIVGEPRPRSGRYGDDRVFAHLRLAGDSSNDVFAAGLAAAGHPVVTVDVARIEDLGAEMFRWEFVTAIASAVLGINAFDQPDVESAKRAGRAALASQEAIDWPVDDPAQLFEGSRPGDLAALLLFAPPGAAAAAALETGRRRLLDELGVATSVGIGPRYLHSTGQLHKGGPKRVRALVVLDPPAEDVPIPGTGHGFARLVTAQAYGDAVALEEAGKLVARTSYGRYKEWANGA